MGRGREEEGECEGKGKVKMKGKGRGREREEKDFGLLKETVMNTDIYSRKSGWCIDRDGQKKV